MKVKDISALVLCLSALVACNKFSQDTPGPETFTEALPLTISATGEGVQTRTALAGGTGDDRNNVVFSATDALAVFDLSGQKTKFTVLNGPYSDGSADFTGSVNEDDDRYYALYPYSDDATSTIKTVSGLPAFSTVVAEVPSVQQAVAGSFDPAAALSAGVAFRSGDGCTLALSNLCALVKFSIPDTITVSKAVFKTKGTEYIAGPLSAKIIHSTGSIESVVPDPFAADGPGEVTLTGDLTGGNWYYISIIPQALSSGFEISFYDDDDILLCTHGTTKPVTLTRNKILNLGELTVTKTLEWAGSGTSSDPYLIYTYEQLALLAQRVKSSPSTYAGKCYKQMTNIVCGGNSITIGGFNSDSPVYFTGTYDGNGHSITDYIPGTAVNGRDRISGLFNQVKNATIKNVSVLPSIFFETIEGSEIFYTAGALVGRAVSDENKSTVISGCSLLEGGNYYLNLMATSGCKVISRIGGLIGACEDCHLTVTGCSSHSNISVSGGLNINDMYYPEGLGGILGYAESDEFEQIVRIDRCRNTGNLNDSNQSASIGVGGIIGSVLEDILSDETVIRISNCVNEGALTAMNPVDSYDSQGIYSSKETYYSFAGGIVGCNDADGGTYDPYIYNCLNKGKLFAADNYGGAGGIVGSCYDDDTTIALCINVGTFTGEEYTKFGAISAMGYEGYWPDEENARCVGCYWLDANDQPAAPAIPVICDNSDTAPVDCYNYRTLTYEYPANRIRKGWNTAATEWTQEQWEACAELWTGSATYGQTQAQMTLDLNF